MLLLGGRVGVMVRISVMVTGTSVLGLVLGVPAACHSSQPARELSPLSDIYQSRGITIRVRVRVVNFSL